jgi:uncharacterized protein YjiS (DUF1127 family)
VLLLRCAATVQLWRHRRASRRELAQLDARSLRDIGIAPEVIEFEMQQPLWRPLRNWRDEFRPR